MSLVKVIYKEDHYEFVCPICGAVNHSFSFVLSIVCDCGETLEVSDVEEEEEALLST